MATLGTLVDSVISEVYGYTATVDPSTYLTVAVDTSAQQFSVASVANFSRGIVQIGDELILIDSVDRDANVLYAGDIRGRGIRGSTVSAHPAGELVLMSPTIPRWAAIKAVRDTLSASSGLFAVQTVTFPFLAVQATYDLPQDTQDVLAVQWLPPGPSGKWITITRWTFDRVGNQIVIGSPVQPGRTVRVLVAKAPVFTALDQEFTTTGLPASCAEVIRLGAAWRVVSFLEPFALMPQSAEADAMDRQTTPGSRIRVAQYFAQMYQLRLTEEINELQRRYPTRIHYGA